ncbi:MAG: substrate-binding domain-containing protein, partial [Planctomycetota bacterium]
PGPGDLAMAMLRNQHAAILTTRPVTDEIRPLGFVRGTDGDWHHRVAAEVRAAAGRYPQLGLQERDCKDGAAAVVAKIAELIELGCHAILVSLDDPAAVAPAMDHAEQRRVTVVVLDPALRLGRATCVVGADQEILGRTAAEQVAAMLPAGGKLVLVDAAAPGLAAARFDGFAKTLGLRAP